MFHDKEGILWVQLTDYNNPRTALLLPTKYQKEALCKAHNSIFGGHNATLKTYIKIMSSYYWPGIFQDVKKYTNLPDLSTKKGPLPSLRLYLSCQF